MPFKRDENFITPKDAWKKIKNYVPKNRLYDPFWINGKSGVLYFKEIGYNVFHQNMDFWEQVDEEFYDTVVCRPPFDLKQDIIIKLIELDKPFILLMGKSVLHTRWFRTLFTDKKIQVIINTKRIKFEDVDGKQIKSNFDTIFYCYKIHLHKDIIFV